MKVAIDAGHGYNTSGRRTVALADGRQMREHEFNRDVAFILGYKLRQAGYKTVFCFDDVDVYDFSLQKRCQIANDAKADIFLSIHASVGADSEKWGDDNGLVAMYYSKPGERLAASVISEMQKLSGMPLNTYRLANEYVLRYTGMPAVIIECGFMTNRKDAEKLMTYEYRMQCAEGIFNGIQSYFKTIPGSDVEVIEIEKMNLGTAKILDSVENLSQKYPNFVNGMFWDNDRLCDLCIFNEEYLEYKPWDTKPKGTFYIYTDGRIGTVTLSKLGTKDVKFCVQGINLSPGADGGSIDLRESMNRQGWELVSDTQVSRRAALGYDSIKDRVKIVIKKCDLHDLRNEVRKLGCVDKNGDTVAIALDSGGSFAYVQNGKIVYNSDGRLMRNIIYW